MRLKYMLGAGISVHAGIPDFRSPNGLFQSLKREHPKENITSGRDLFDAAVFKSEETTALFYKMISHLATLSDAAQPTPFHDMLRNLDARGQLLRVYTQNIDALEERAGLSFGVPTFPSRSRKRKAETSHTQGTSPIHPRSSSSERSTAPSPASHLYTPSSSAQTSPASTPVPTPQLPRCVPLHGTLKHLYCPSCYLTLPLCKPEYLESLGLGNPLACPQCTELDGTRRLVGKRTRGVARLRPGVVLYNEPHREGEAERVGECVRRDLIGLGSGQLSRTNSGRKRRGGDDLLIVAGTSLRIPGAKRIVREFAKALHPTSCVDSDDYVQTHQSAVKTVYLNLQFPVPAREWDGVFDFWVQGDVQTFARGFEKYQLEIERSLASVGGPSTAVQSKPNTPSRTRQPRALMRDTRSRRSTSEPTPRSNAAPKPKHMVPSALKAPVLLRNHARALHPIDMGHQPFNPSPTQIKHAPESVSTRFKIKIKRPMSMHTPDEPKLQPPTIASTAISRSHTG
ncbi:NAD-dependent protein deacetylase hst4 [Rhizoctonia solani]|uniref:NAD-dependent protein deacetylase hst4 n=1 Tax=Rhizoctonia solani TaxID=456999 RepID=A0A0K6GCD2_9AGAM|nr:NAD-dependent protein deacetylase hst4 [Rhizoctonia solani]